MQRWRCFIEASAVERDEEKEEVEAQTHLSFTGEKGNKGRPLQGQGSRPFKGMGAAELWVASDDSEAGMSAKSRRGVSRPE